MNLNFYLLLLMSPFLFAQKAAHIPEYLADSSTHDGAQFSLDKTAQSNNFIVIWGNTVGTDPVNYSDNPDYAFDPEEVLRNMEIIYQIYKDYGFALETPGTNLAKYKIALVMNHTFGEEGSTGWAFGGSQDNIMGTLWLHPKAAKGGHASAHEIIHSLQAQNNIDYRKPKELGDAWKNSGIFWETHANFMRSLIYPELVNAWGADWDHIETFGNWVNIYENFAYLIGIVEADGMNIINRLWQESKAEEYPIQAYKRLSNFSIKELNDHLFNVYAKKMATYDFSIKNIGHYFREKRNLDLEKSLESMQSVWTILDQDKSMSTHFSVPIHLAPEEFAYNIIPIYPNDDSHLIHIKFKGHIEANSHAGWRYGFVSSDGKTTRYGEMYDENELEIEYQMLSNETELYFVVMGAPKDSITTNTTTDTWKGYPKHFHFPYELNILGGVPEGYQEASNFRKQLKKNGTTHSNGGGWVENSALVADSVYVGPYAMVLGNSKITGHVRIEERALVKDAIISDHVIVTDNAFIKGGTYSNDAKIAGQAFLENDIMMDRALVHMRAKVKDYTLRGNIEIGGNVVVYNDEGDCDNGVYYRMTNYYENNLLECDNRDENHPENSDVNNKITPFINAEMIIKDPLPKIYGR
ncbi:DUF6055 domain-containing protein [Mariniflexile litorale]|uniref:DUF6055 domain-containing protein n=1 Tax=Mariniflexile litorale TaxID=3045158 RepID=A0AAU7EHP3_9FLAO|nr:DUF6055 domain-containing protein [Mariniflexile sp. KMM 9835]MDQ8209994.1 DUF6055 domain-containing protein [Mariniflexile sp. KMM 9835]